MRADSLSLAAAAGPAADAPECAAAWHQQLPVSSGLEPGGRTIRLADFVSIGAAAMRRLWDRTFAILSNPGVGIGASAIIVASFFFIHGYAPRLGIIGNASYGEIWLSSECVMRDPRTTLQGVPSDAVASGHEIPVDYDPFASCVRRLPYRFVLASMIALVAINLMLKSRVQRRRQDH